MMAIGTLTKGQVLLSRLERLDSLEDFDQWLRQERDWLDAFDFLFGLPRELVTYLGWPTQWIELINHYASLSRLEIRNTFAAFCNARPVGQKFFYRGTDGSSGASSSMKWVNPPVAFMLHAGVPRLLAAGVQLPGLYPGDGRRIALEGYPGMLAREILGIRSYKSDNRFKQTPERLIARKGKVSAGFSVKIHPHRTQALHIAHQVEIEAFQPPLMDRVAQKAMYSNRESKCRFLNDLKVV